jgi:hypothetical protein
MGAEGGSTIFVYRAYPRVYHDPEESPFSARVQVSEVLSKPQMGTAQLHQPINIRADAHRRVPSAVSQFP